MTQFLLPCDGTGEMPVAAMPASEEAEKPYVERVALELCRSGRFQHPWLGTCSSGEFATLCLAVGTPAAMKRLHDRYRSIADAWGDIDHTHRAVIQRVWEVAKFL